MFQLLIVFIFLISFSPGAGAQNPNSAADSYSEFDLVIDAIPRQVETIAKGSFANAVEPLDGLKGLGEIVSFRVKEVLKRPSFGKEKGGQGKRAALPRVDPNAIVNWVARGGVQKLFRRNSVNAGTDWNDRWFRIAVKSARESFNIESRASIEPAVYRIYLKTHGAERSSFVMVKHEVIAGPEQL